MSLRVSVVMWMCHLAGRVWLWSMRHSILVAYCRSHPRGRVLEQGTLPPGKERVVIIEGIL